MSFIDARSNSNKEGEECGACSTGQYAEWFSHVFISNNKVKTYNVRIEKALRKY